MPKLNHNGFTLVEMLIVVAILSTLAISAAGFGAQSLTKSQLSAYNDDVVVMLRQAQARSVAGYQDDDWSVRIDTTEYILFKGNDWSGRDTSYDIARAFPAAVSASGLAEVNFDYGTGRTTDTGTITISHAGTGESKSISVNEVGKIE